MLRGEWKQSLRWQYPGCNAGGRYISTPYVAADKICRNKHIPVKGIFNDQCARPIWIQARNTLNAISVGVGVTSIVLQNSRSRRNVLTKLCHHVVGDIEVIVRRPIERYQPVARVATTRCKMRTSTSVCTQSPRSHTICPVLKRAHGKLCSMCPTEAL